MDILSKNKIKWIRSLRLKKNRTSEGVFIVEGPKIVSEIIQEESDKIEMIVTTDPDFHGTRTTFITDSATMKSISALSTPSPIMAVVKQPQFDAPPSNWILAVDGVQDPGNLGTIIRTADWFGINTIVCSHETVDCFNPKVIQSTMGSIFRVHLDYTNLEEFLNQSELPIFGALMEGESVFNSSIPESGILVMGNEGNGISENLLPLINHPIHIPGRGQAESLNVAVATGILLGQLSR